MYEAHLLFCDRSLFRILYSIRTHYMYCVFCLLRLLLSDGFSRYRVQVQEQQDTGSVRSNHRLGWVKQATRKGYIQIKVDPSYCGFQRCVIRTVGLSIQIMPGHFDRVCRIYVMISSMVFLFTTPVSAIYCFWELLHVVINSAHNLPQIAYFILRSNKSVT